MRNVTLAVLLMLAGASPAMATDAPLAAGRLLDLQQAGQAPLLLDVRHADEFHDGHIAGALNIPEEQLGSRVGALGVPRDREIVVYCVAGRRAARAQDTLQSHGYSHVRLLDGSLDAWRQQNFPLVHERAP
jgi:phage shock protein E